MKAGRVALVAVFVLATAYFAYRFEHALRLVPPGQGLGVDFSINWTAAQAARHGSSLYSNTALRALSVRYVGAWTADLYSATFTSYIGPPSTALLHIPYTWLPFGVAINIHRVESALLFAAGVFIAGLALPKESRPWGWIVGSLGLLTVHGIVVSLALAQVDAWIVLGLALAFYGTRTRKWALVGVGIGIGATLKITPVLLLVYLLIRGRRRAALAGAATCVALVGAGTVVSGFADLRTFITDVAPKLAAGSISEQNQSLPAYAARVLGDRTDFIDLQTGLGGFRYLGLAGAAALMLTLAWRRRKHPVVPLEVGVVVLVGLVFAPITWDHSASWAVVVLVLLADRRVWRPPRAWVLLALGIGALAMTVPTRYYTAMQIQQRSFLRYETGFTALGLALWLIAAWALLEAHTRRVDRARPAGSRESPQPVGSG